MRVNESKKGFTIVEVILSMLAFGIMALTVGTVMLSSWSNWRDFREAIAMQRDAMIAMKIMATEIRNSNINEISGDSDGLDFSVNGTRDNAFVFNKSDIAFSSGVELNQWDRPDIFSSSSNNYVTVGFSLRTSGGAYQDRYEMTIHPRNNQP